MKQLLLVFFLFICVSPALAWEGFVVSVTDGDTIKVLDSAKKLHKIRLYGIDTPEKKQAFGTRAKQLMAELVFNQRVDIEEFTTDRYGRTIGMVRLPSGMNVNAEMVRRGMAWVYTRYCKEPFFSDWKQSEEAARSGKLGLWSDPHTVAPWQWRKRQ